MYLVIVCIISKHHKVICCYNIFISNQ